jgi:hypothetical protein
VIRTGRYDMLGESQMAMALSSFLQNSQADGSSLSKVATSSSWLVINPGTAPVSKLVLKRYSLRDTANTIRYTTDTNRGKRGTGRTYARQVRNRRMRKGENAI